MAYYEKNREKLLLYKKNYYKENKDKLKQRNKEWRNSEAGKKAKQKEKAKRFGLSLENYEQMLLEQNNVCKVCEEPETENKSLAIDHDHKTGQVRGLLCGKCNKAIGLLRDNAELLRKAADYLEK